MTDTNKYETIVETIKQLEDLLDCEDVELQSVWDTWVTRLAIKMGQKIFLPHYFVYIIDATKLWMSSGLAQRSIPHPHIYERQNERLKLSYQNLYATCKLSYLRLLYMMILAILMYLPQSWFTL